MIGLRTDSFDRQLEELWKKSLSSIRVRVEFVKQKFPDLLKQARAGQLQMWVGFTYAGFHQH